MEGCQNGDPAGSKVIKRMMSKVCRRPRMGRRNEKAKIRRKPSPEDTIFRKNSGPRARRARILHTQKAACRRFELRCVYSTFRKAAGRQRGMLSDEDNLLDSPEPTVRVFFFPAAVPWPLCPPNANNFIPPTFPPIPTPSLLSLWRRRPRRGSGAR